MATRSRQSTAAGSSSPSASPSTSSSSSSSDENNNNNNNNDHSLRTSSSAAVAAVGESGRILSAKYLQKASNKRDLIVRLRRVLQVLRDDEDVEADDRSYPGLSSLCHALVRFVDHRDKEVRLYTVGCCMELFTVYAPEAPWTADETLEIFRQTIRQLGNLAHTTSPKQPHFYDYYRILEMMATVKIPVLLVDLYKVNDDHRKRRSGRREDKKKKEQPQRRSSSRLRRGKKQDQPQEPSRTDADDRDSLTDPEDDDDDYPIGGATGQEALSILTDLFRTLLDSVRIDHPREILDFCEQTITSSVEEFFESTLFPVPILDQILLSVGQGRNVLVLQQQQAQRPPTAGRSSKRPLAIAANNDNKTGPPAPLGAPQYVQQTNPSYMVASAVLRHNMERLSSPIATLLNGLVNSDSRSVSESTLSNQLEEKRGDCEWNGPEEAAEKSKRGGKHKKEPETTPAEKAILEMAEGMGRPQPQQQDSQVTSHVWNIIYELQFVAPSILTTVVGNLASHIGTADFGRRVMVTQTLGKIFANGRRNSTTGELNLTIALEYGPCFRQWLERSEDRRLEIRRLMLPHLLALAKACPSSAVTPPPDNKAELIREVQNTLLNRLVKDPSVCFRLEVIQGLCNIAYQHRRILSKELMDRIGMQVLSKNREERKNALTGLVQMYFRQYLKFHLQPVSEGGDDCPLKFVLDVLDKCCRRPPPPGGKSEIETRLSLLSPKGKGRERKRPARRSKGDDETDSEHDEEDVDQENESQDDFEYYQWIPPLLFQSFSYTDSFDSEMRSRVVMLVDDLLLGSELPLPDNKRRLTSTARATGLAVIVDVVRNRAPLAWRWMGDMLDTRAKLQSALKAYIDARADIRNHVSGSEEFLAAESKAMDLLENVASMIPAPSGASPAPGERHPLLEKIHSIKDRNIFRILGTITHPNHSVNARIRAMDDLPKRVKATGAGEAATTWVRSLVKRCAMGDFLNQDIVHHCVILAHECFHKEEFETAQRFLACVHMASMRFPQLCASEEDFGTLSELFRDSSGVSYSKKNLINSSGMMTSLSAILATVSPHRAFSEQPTKCEEDIHRQLIDLCSDGTPEQARHATATMVALLKPKEGPVLTEEQTNAFLPLLQTLATPSQLSMAARSSSTKLASVLVSLAEVGEHAPKIFDTEKRGQNALKFALDVVLLGRKATASADSASDNDSCDEEENDEEKYIEKTPTGRRSKADKVTVVEDHLSPTNHHKSLVDDDNLTTSCRTLCAAVEFVSTYIRSSVLTNKQTKEEMSADIQAFIESVFEALSNIIRDEGMPPSPRDRKCFGLRQDRAALRQCAAIQLLRLCDTRLGLDQKFLTTKRWHILADIFLDEERVVRIAVMDELGEMLTANGKYSVAFGQQAMAPRLRFLAYAVLCTDGDHNANHAIANGGAANVGKNVHNVLGNARGCVSYLRKVYEAGAAQARANGDEAEKRYQTFTKVTVMPEYSVPYAFHLLAFRRETPLAEGGRKERSADEDYAFDGGTRSDEDKAVSVLSKRIRNLLEILTATADGNNVSFLLRMTEIISKKIPKLGAAIVDEDHQRKLLKVCQVSREVLLSQVKRDENLTAFPGKILIPGNLFQQGHSKKTVRALASVPTLNAVPTGEINKNDNVEKTSRNETGELTDVLEDKSTDVETSQSHRDSSSDGHSLLSSQENEDGVSRRLTRSGSKRKSIKSDATNDPPSLNKRNRQSLDDSMTSEQSPNKSVHFSPDKPVEFEAVSPIVKCASPDNVLLTSGETKTRGTTPPTQQSKLTESTAKSPTPVSSDSLSKETDRRPDIPTPKSTSKRRTHRYRSSNGKENASGVNKKRKNSKERPHAIKTIKIVRKRSPDLKNNMPKPKSTHARGNRKRKAMKAVDPLDFDA